MSYIAFDLDALNVAPDVARAADLTEDRVIGGLSRLWAWCFRSATDRVTAIHIKGFFGADCTQVLSVFGFLEVDGAEFRVKGADRYLRVKEARSQNGKAAAARGNLKRGKSVGEISPTASSTPPNSAPTEPQQASSPTPSTEHRAPNTDKKEEEALLLPEKGRLIIWDPPKTDPETWNALDFWGWAQSRRQKAGFVGEQKLPFDLRKWFSGAMLSLGGKTEVLQEAFLNFGDDPYWQKQKPVTLPFAGFMAQWATFLPRGVHVS